MLKRFPGTAKILVVVIICAALLPQCKKNLSTSLPQSPSMDSVQAPSMTTNVIMPCLSEGINTYRIPAMVVTNKGTVLAMCDGRVPNGADLPNKIECVLRRSTDNGLTWSNLIRALADTGMQGTGDPSLLVDRATGRIWAFVNYGAPGVGQANSMPGFGTNTLHVLAIKSDDDGLTWSKPIDLTRSIKSPGWQVIVSSPGHGIQLADGTLVQPGYFRYTNSQVFNSYIFYSKDHGLNWSFSTPVGPNTGENSVVQLKDGSIVANIRSYRGAGCRAIAQTYDLGKTWNAISDAPELPDPICEGSIVRLKNYRLGNDNSPILFSNDADAGTRDNLTLRLSEDDGVSWKYSRVLFPGANGYSDVALLNDGTIGVLFEWSHSIAFAKLNLAWLEATSY